VYLDEWHAQCMEYAYYKNADHFRSFGSTVIGSDLQSAGVLWNMFGAREVDILYHGSTFMLFFVSSCSISSSFERW
jgi:hypothetical protein